MEAQPFASDEKLAVRRLMTIGGVHMTVALGGQAAIGDIARFSSPDKLVSCLGLNPSVCHSGNGPAHHGQITKQGRSHARAMLVEAAWAAARVPGPLRAFFLRIQRRRGQQIAAVATARKMVVIVWHLLTKTENYAWARPALLEAKLRRVELAAGQPAVKGRQQGRAYAYNSKAVRDRERVARADREGLCTFCGELADQATERVHGCHNWDTLIEGDVTGLHP